MKKLLIVAFAFIAFNSCVQKGDFFIKSPNANRVKIDKLYDEIDHGLYKLTIDDTTQILIYRGVESCTMIKLK